MNELDKVLHDFAGCGFPHPHYVYCQWCDNLSEVKQAIEAHISEHYIKKEDVLEAIDVEPCETNCSDTRHAYHEGQWKLAQRIEEKLNLGDK